MHGVGLAEERPITIAILAIGGQGGGVLCDWIGAAAEASGWLAQMTSVPGVAQRTGATVYYVETLPRRDRAPVLALMPTPGDVDIVIAAEMMEAGRAIQRGLVTPDRTVLIASTHRSFAIEEKSAPGDGVADSGKVLQAAAVAAKDFIGLDMVAIAERNGSVISSALLGALAASGTLPFPREAFEDAIRAGGVGVGASLATFAECFDATLGRRDPARAPASPPAPERRAPAAKPASGPLRRHIEDQFPKPAWAMLEAGMERVLDFQDRAYAEEYLARLRDVAELDRMVGGEARGFELTVEAARQVAVAMSYDDVIRVADLKTRAARFERVRKEVGVDDGQLLHMTEFMHPRMEEVTGTLPAGLGLWLERRPGLVRVLDRWVNRGRRIRTDTIKGFLALYAVGGFKRFRRSTLRHRREMEHLETWLGEMRDAALGDYRLACEILRNRRLVKGYSDTHARGTSKFDLVMGASRRLRGRSDAADWVKRLRDAALRDEDGKALRETLLTVESFL